MESPMVEMKEKMPITIKGKRSAPFGDHHSQEHGKKTAMESKDRNIVGDHDAHSSELGVDLQQLSGEDHGHTDNEEIDYFVKRSGVKTRKLGDGISASGNGDMVPDLDGVAAVDDTNSSERGGDHENNGDLEQLPSEDHGDIELNGKIDAEYDFDYFVIGGGSGGIASAIQAAKHGVRVGLCDFVTPTPSGTNWGLGGTCVNVGCIPMKLMHQAALLGKSLQDAPHFGWILDDPTGAVINHDWNKMVEKIHAHLRSLNWGYRVSLQTAGVEYYNALAEFVDEHTVKLSGKNENMICEVTSKYFLIATGCRPRYLDIVGGKPGEYCITSDDLFTLPHSPGKVVILGSNKIAVEIAGVLRGIGLDVTVMVRSKLLRGFDKEMAEKIGECLERHGVHLMRDFVPFKIEAIAEGEPRGLMVHAKNQQTGEILEEPCNTVILAVGRSPSVAHLNVERIGINLDPNSGKIIANDKDQTNIHNVFAVGDICEGRPEHTPVASQAGVLLARRLFSNSNIITEYDKVPTTIFTPLEYGCVGCSEEEAKEVYGEDDLEVYHVTSQPLEFTLPQRDKNSCYSKVICVKSQQERICGFHYLGPNAGEVLQGFVLAIKMNATKQYLDGTIGIHPTCAEEITTMHVTKASGEDWIKTGC